MWRSAQRDRHPCVCSTVCGGALKSAKASGFSVFVAAYMFLCDVLHDLRVLSSVLAAATACRFPTASHPDWGLARRYWGRPPTPAARHQHTTLTKRRAGGARRGGRHRDGLGSACCICDIPAREWRCIAGKGGDGENEGGAGGRRATATSKAERAVRAARAQLRRCAAKGSQRRAAQTSRCFSLTL